MKRHLKSIASFFVRHRATIGQALAIAAAAVHHFLRFYGRRSTRTTRPNRSKDPRPLKHLR